MIPKEPTEKEQTIFQMIWEVVAKILSLFAEKPKEVGALVEISDVPKKGDKTGAVKILKAALNKHGAKLDETNDYFGNTTEKAVSDFQKSKGLVGTGIIPANGGKTFELLGLVLKKKSEPVKEEAPKDSSKIPWFWAAKKHEGKHEDDKAFTAYMNQYWVKTGLPSFKGLSGSARAWCGIFAAMGLIVAGTTDIPKNSFRAISWDGHGHPIEWKKDGIPQGAFIRINSSGNCKSASGNHITMANGDCSASDLLKSGATFSAYGGNQGNRAKVSTYSVSRICSVTWPKRWILQLPKVTKSVNCSNGKTSNESTR